MGIKLDFLNGAIYERELVGIFSGNEKTVKTYSKKLDDDGRIAALSMIRKPFFVTRSAGSLGADLVAMRDDFSFVVEVKSSINDTLSFGGSTGRMQDQAQRLDQMCQRAGLFVLYAYRMKGVAGDPWKVFAIPAEVTGRLRNVYSILPNVGITRNGNFVLKWNEGMSLSRFIEYINQEF